jgi:hypothetical protein
LTVAIPYVLNDVHFQVPANSRSGLARSTKMPGGQLGSELLEHDDQATAKASGTSVPRLLFMNFRHYLNNNPVMSCLVTSSSLPDRLLVFAQESNYVFRARRSRK